MFHLVDEVAGPLLGGDVTGSDFASGRLLLTIMLLLLRLVKASNRYIVKLRKFLLDEVHNVAVDLVLQTSGRLQSVRRRLDIIINELIDSIAAFLYVFQLASVNAHLLTQTGLVPDEKLRALVKTLDVNHEIFGNVENVL